MAQATRSYLAFFTIAPCHSNGLPRSIPLVFLCPLLALQRPAFAGLEGMDSC